MSGVNPERDVYTVGRLNREARMLLESGLPALWIEGEISNFSSPVEGRFGQPTTVRYRRLPHDPRSRLSLMAISSVRSSGVAGASTAIRTLALPSIPPERIIARAPSGRTVQGVIKFISIFPDAPRSAKRSVTRIALAARSNRTVRRHFSTAASFG